MPMFKVQAFDAKTNEAIAAEIFIGGRSYGFTKKSTNDYLNVELSGSGNYQWYAKYHGETIDSGTSSGGNIRALYSH